MFLRNNLKFSRKFVRSRLVVEIRFEINLKFQSTIIYIVVNRVVHSSFSKTYIYRGKYLHISSREIKITIFVRMYFDLSKRSPEGTIRSGFSRRPIRMEISCVYSVTPTLSPNSKISNSRNTEHFGIKSVYNPILLFVRDFRNLRLTSRFKIHVSHRSRGLMPDKVAIDILWGRRERNGRIYSEDFLFDVRPRSVPGTAPDTIQPLLNCKEMFFNRNAKNRKALNNYCRLKRIMN